MKYAIENKQSGLPVQVTLREEVTEMPGFDGTGPRGMGPMTGGGRGFCASPVYGPRPGYGAGFGWPARGGRGRGVRRGMGRGMAYPYAYGTGMPYAPFPSGGRLPYAPNPYAAVPYGPHPYGW